VALRGIACRILGERVSIRTISATSHGTYRISIHKHLGCDELLSSSGCTNLHRLRIVGSTVGTPSQLKGDDHPLPTTHRFKWVIKGEGVSFACATTGVEVPIFLVMFTWPL
jgi:hypothetical protein